MPKTSVSPGHVVIDTKEITDNTAKNSDKFRIVAISEFDCDPAPGSERHFLRSKKYEPELVNRFFKQAEMKNLHAVSNHLGVTSTVDNIILDRIAKTLEFKFMPVWYTGDLFKKMRQVTKCFKTTQYLRINYKIFEIKVSVNPNVTIKTATTTFPPGFVLATYRIREPYRFRFETLHRWNKLCCPKKPTKEPKGQITSWYWPFVSLITRDDLEPFKPRPQ